MATLVAVRGEGAVVVLMHGGLGNQLFQYAAGRRLSLVRGVPLALDLSWFARQSLRTFGLGAFDVQASLSGPVEGLPVLRDVGLRFQEDVLHARAPVVLAGHWQSERYFADIAEQVVADLTVLAPPSPRSVRIAALVDAEPDAVAVHVRRGDYVTDAPARAALGLLPADYYRRALDRVRELVPGPRFFVFSDDPGWAAGALSGPDTVIIDEPAGGAHEDLMLMARCRHHVVANSSYGWWGAWLGDARRGAAGVTIAPRPWFRSPLLDTTDALPPHWIRLDH